MPKYTPNRIVDLTDTNLAPGAGTDGHLVGWDNTAGEFQLKAPATGGGALKVRCATTTNITIATALNVGDAIDGVTLANGDRVLVKNQTTATENGIYVAGATPARASDFDTGATVAAELIVVKEGTENADSFWLVSNNDGSDVVGTDNITIIQTPIAGVIDAGQITSGTFDNARISAGNVTQHEAALDHDNLAGVDAHNTGDRHRVINEGTEALRSTNFPPATHVGEYHVTTDTGIMTRSNGTDWIRVVGGTGASTTKSGMVLSPAASTNYRLFGTDDASLTWQRVDLLVGGSSPDIDWTIHHGTTFGTSVGVIATADGTTGEITPIETGGTIPANSHVWIVLDAINSGTVSFVAVDIHHEAATADPSSGTADALSTTGADVVVSSAAPPTAGQVLRASSATAAVWSSDIAASSLRTTGANVVLTSGAPPVTGQALVASSPTAASWGAPPASNLGIGVWNVEALTSGTPSLGNIRFNNSSKALTSSCNIHATPQTGPEFSSVANMASCLEAGMVLHFWKQGDAANHSGGYRINSVTENATWVTLSLASLGGHPGITWVVGDDYVLSVSGAPTATSWQEFEASDASSDVNSVVPGNFSAFAAGNYLMRVSGNVSAISGGTLTLRVARNVSTVIRSVDVTATGWFEFEAAWAHPGAQPINFTHQMSAGQTATIENLAIQLRTITDVWA